MVMKRELVFGFVFLIVGVFGMIWMISIHEVFSIMMFVGFIISTTWFMISLAPDRLESIPNGSEYELEGDYVS